MDTTERWRIYQARIDYASVYRDPHFVDFCADRALVSVKNGCDGTSVGMWCARKRVEYIRLKRSTECSLDALAEGGYEPSTVDTPEDTDYWTGLDQRIRAKVRSDAQDLTLAVARLLADGWSLVDIAARLDRPVSRIHAAKMRLAAIV
jgi:hypothetical protein